jgi:hypothetical protein
MNGYQSHTEDDVSVHRPAHNTTKKRLSVCPHVATPLALLEACCGGNRGLK